MSAAPDRPTWDPALYDEGYYRRGERCGFKSYDYGSLEQQQQLAMKWAACQTVPHESALFVGCALGHEVAFWRARNRHARGVDVSAYAIANQIPHAEGGCYLYDGRTLDRFDADSADLVAAFDVLTHVPDEMLEALAAEMVRVARRGIVFRTIFKNWRNMDAAVDFQDGCWGRYLRLEQWDRLFTASGKFKLQEAHLTRDNYETTFTFARA